MFIGEKKYFSEKKKKPTQKKKEVKNHLFFSPKIFLVIFLPFKFFLLQLFHMRIWMGE